MTEKELIRAEIARYIREEVCSGYSSIACCRDLLKFIDSLPEVKPSRDLEEEVKRYYSDNFTYISSDQPTLSILTNVARHFAEWQKGQMHKDAEEDALLLERAWLTLDGFGHEELAGRLRQFAERKGLIWK